MTDNQKFQASVASLTEEQKKVAMKGNIKSMADMVVSYQERVFTADKRRLNLTRWLPVLGSYVRPLMPGDFAVILADTGSGKTAVLQSIAYYACAPLPTLFFEIELADDLMCERMLSMHAKKPAHVIEELIKMQQIPEIKGEFNHLRFCMLSGISMEQIEEMIVFQNANTPQPVAVVMVDYMGLIKAKSASRYERFSNIAEEMKAMAKRLNVILFVSCQVRREAGEAASPIHLHAAKESGSIENSAGLVLGVWREGIGGKDMKIKILKNTRGAPGHTIDACFDAETMRILPQKFTP